MEGVAVDFELAGEAARDESSRTGYIGERRGCLVGQRGGAVDVATGTVTLKPGAKIQVTVKMAMEFEGKFTLKALNPVTLAQYASLDLETNYAV